MSLENRITAINLYAEIPASFFNDLQDNFCFAWQLDQSTLAPTATWEGLTLYYGQFTFATAGPVTVLDSSRDWRNRIMEARVVMVTAANELPTGVAYDPNLGGGSWAWNLWSTEGGVAPAAAPGAPAWSPVANEYIYAANAAGLGAAAGDLCWSNNTGADTYGFLMLKVSPDVS